jgi:hypothetical protein
MARELGESIAMKVLGFRGDPKAPRYAVVSEAGGVYTLENTSSDNKLSVPASIGEDQYAEGLAWVYREILAVLEAHPGIERVVIKQNEFTRSDDKAKRHTAHIDAAVVLACALKNVPVALKLYGSLSTKRSETKSHAELRVGKSTRYWDEKMADAVNAAWWGLRQP